MLNLIFWEKHQFAGYMTEVQQLFFSIFGSGTVVFDGYPENLTTTDNSYKCCLTYYFKKKKDAFAGNTVNKHL